MAISKKIREETARKLVYALSVAITAGVAKQIYRKLPRPANYIFLALLNFFYSIFVFLLLMSLVAARIKVIAETFPQFRIFTDSSLLVPFAIVSFGFVYIFLILLLQWYFEEKPLSEVAEIFVKSIAKDTKVVKDAAAAGIKAGVKKTGHIVKSVAKGAKVAKDTVVPGVKAVVKNTGYGASTITKITAKGAGKAGSAVKKIILTLIRKPVHQNPEQEIDSAEDTQKQ